MTEFKMFGDHDDNTIKQMARCMSVGSVAGGVLSKFPAPISAYGLAAAGVFFGAGVLDFFGCACAVPIPRLSAMPSPTANALVMGSP